MVLGSATLRLVLLAALVPLTVWGFGYHGQHGVPPSSRRVEVACEDDLLAALTDDSIDRIVLLKDIRLSSAAWEAQVGFPLHIKRNVTIKSALTRNAFATLDLSFRAGKLHLEPGVWLTIYRLRLRGLTASSAPSFPFVDVSEGAHVLFLDCLLHRLSCLPNDLVHESILATPRPESVPGDTDVQLLSSHCIRTVSSGRQCFPDALRLQNYAYVAPRRTFGGAVTGGVMLHAENTSLVCDYPATEECVRDKGPDFCVTRELARHQQRQERAARLRTALWGGAGTLLALAAGWWLLGGGRRQAPAPAPTITPRASAADLHALAALAAAQLNGGHFTRSSYNSALEPLTRSSWAGSYESYPTNEPHHSSPGSACVPRVEASGWGHATGPLSEVDALLRPGCQLVAHAGGPASTLSLKPAGGLATQQQRLLRTHSAVPGCSRGDAGPAAQLPECAVAGHAAPGRGGTRATLNGSGSGSGDADATAASASSYARAAVETQERIELLRRNMRSERTRAEVDLWESLQVTALLGSGTFGKVFKGFWNGTLVAVKVMVFPAAPLSGGGQLERMAAMEAAIATSLSHPNIVQTYTAHVTPLNSWTQLDAAAAFSSATPATAPLHLNGGAAALTNTRRRLAPPKRTASARADTGSGGGAAGPSSLAAHAAAARLQQRPWRTSTGGAVRLEGHPEEEDASQHPPQAPGTAVRVHNSKEDTAVEPAAGGPAAALAAAAGLAPSAMAGGFELCLILELCDAGSLRDALSRGGFRCPETSAVDYGSVLDIAADVARALAYLHAQSIVHSDLKSRNVLLKSLGGDPAALGRSAAVVGKVSDFGLSFSMDDNETHVSNMFQGTATFMAPELLLHGRVSKAADVYSFGILLWELYTCGEAFKNIPKALLAARVVEGMRPDFPPETPAEYVDLAERCWAAEAADRPSFDTIVRELSAMRSRLRGEYPACASGFLGSAPLSTRNPRRSIMLAVMSEGAWAPYDAAGGGGGGGAIGGDGGAIGGGGGALGAAAPPRPLLLHSQSSPSRHAQPADAAAAEQPGERRAGGGCGGEGDAAGVTVGSALTGVAASEVRARPAPLPTLAARDIVGLRGARGVGGRGGFGAEEGSIQGCSIQGLIASNLLIVGGSEGSSTVATLR